MIDYANLVYTRVKNAISSLCSNSGQTYENTVSTFPYLYLSQKDNPIRSSASDMEDIENAVQPLVEIKVYTTGTGKLTNAKKIISLADEEMQRMKFRRTFGPQEVTNMSDTNICQVVARYTRTICNGDIL